MSGCGKIWPSARRCLVSGVCVFETKTRNLNDEDPNGLEGEHPIATLDIGLVKVKKDRYPEHYLDTLEMDLIRKVEENRKRKIDGYVRVHVLYIDEIIRGFLRCVQPTDVRPSIKRDVIRGLLR